MTQPTAPVTVQYPPAVQVPIPAVVEGVNWILLVPVIVAGLGLLMGQWFTFLQNKAATAERATASKATAAIALDTAQQTTKLERIEVLVDGRYGEVLQQLADVKRLLAAATGIRGDQIAADHAQDKADEQNARVAAATPAVKP